MTDTSYNSNLVIMGEVPKNRTPIDRIEVEIRIVFILQNKVGVEILPILSTLRILRFVKYWWYHKNLLNLKIFL